MTNRDFKREHFENRAIGKFQSNVYDKFRKLESELTNQKNSLTNAISEAISEIPEFPEIPVAASAAATGLTVVLNKTAGRPVVISFSGSEVSSDGAGYVRLKKNGIVIKSYSLGGSYSSQSYCFMFYDGGTETGNVTYTVEYASFSPVTISDRYLIAHEV